MLQHNTCPVPVSLCPQRKYIFLKKKFNLQIRQRKRPTMTQNIIAIYYKSNVTVGFKMIPPYEIM